MANEFFTDEHTSVLQKMVQEVVNDPSTYLGAKYLPSVALPTNKIRVEVVEATGGLTLEHARGTDAKYIRKGGSRVQEFAPGAYKEGIHFDEEEILHLRELGKNDASRRGIRQYLDLAIDRLNRRLEARIEKLRWDTIFGGTYSYMGNVFSYGIPAANRVVPGTVWGTLSSGVYLPNNSANPLQDIRLWTMGATNAYRKYRIKKMIMNPNTARLIVENTNTKSYITSMGANPNIAEWDLQKILNFTIPAGPAVEVYDGWYQAESDVNGKLTVGDATYMIPDGYIFFEATLPGGDMIGEFVQGIHLASGSVDSPGFGKFLVVEENIAPGTKGGPSNPYIDVWAGVYGAPKLDRYFDVLTAKVV